jgi:glutamate carboxypeptidase
LAAARANGDIVSARKGDAVYTLFAQGRSAHAGVEPEKGRNAIIELAHQTLQFASLNQWREGLSINPGIISGGTAPNVVPDSAQVRFDMRFLHTADRIARAGEAAPTRARSALFAIPALCYNLRRKFIPVVLP